MVIDPAAALITTDGKILFNRTFENDVLNVVVVPDEVSSGNVSACIDCITAAAAATAVADVEALDLAVAVVAMVVDDIAIVDVVVNAIGVGCVVAVAVTVTIPTLPIAVALEFVDDINGGGKFIE